MGKLKNYTDKRLEKKCSILEKKAIDAQRKQVNYHNENRDLIHGSYSPRASKAREKYRKLDHKTYKAENKHARALSKVITM